MSSRERKLIILVVVMAKCSNPMWFGYLERMSDEVMMKIHQSMVEAKGVREQFTMKWDDRIFNTFL